MAGASPHRGTIPSPEPSSRDIDWRPSDSLQIRQPGRTDCRSVCASNKTGLSSRRLQQNESQPMNEASKLGGNEDDVEMTEMNTPIGENRSIDLQGCRWSTTSKGVGGYFFRHYRYDSGRQGQDHCRSNETTKQKQLR